jgi:cation diffusion facilitator family transporter
MDRLTRSVVRRAIDRWEDVHDPAVRHAYAALEGWTSIVVNGLLALVKGLFGVLSGSVALIADAFHTLSDVSTSIVIVISFRVAKRPSDAIHPFGHGRMEAIGTVVVAVLLMVVGLEVFKGGAARLLHPQAFQASWLVMVIIALTMLTKELLSRFSRALAHMIDSAALEADSWHHRTDALSSFLVIGAFLGQKLGIAYLDGIAGMMVAGMIGYTGWRVARRGVDDLLGKQPSESLIRQVREAVGEFPEILDVHELIVHSYGNMNVMSFHIQVSDEMLLKDVHDLSERVEARVNERFRTHATIHCDPVNIRDPETKRVREYVRHFLAAHDSASYHDLRIEERGGVRTVFFDLVVDPRMTQSDVDRMVQRLRWSLLKAFSNVERVVIEVEPKYAV